MKEIAALLLFLCVSSAYFGNATITVEKQWNLSGNSPEIKLAGIFLLNDSNQRVVKIDAEPPLEIKAEGGRLLAVYNGPLNGSAVFRARAVVITDYDAEIKLDEPLAGIPLKQDGLVWYNDEMEALARGLADNKSSLKTLVSLANWISENIDYDYSYSDSFLPAEKVFSERSGVCAEYAHLFIALANAVGFNTRYVAGYVMTNGEWQPHGWAEAYVDGKWVSFDPTFRQAGRLDNSHVAFSYGKDADSVADRVESYGKVDLDTAVILEMKEDNMRKGDADVDFHFFPEDGKGRITVKNLREHYLLGTYSRIVPEEDGVEKRIVMIEPYGVYEDEYWLNQNLQAGYSYSIPIIVSFNDAEKIKKIEFEIEEKNNEEQTPSNVCISAFFIAAIALFFRKI